MSEPAAAPAQPEPAPSTPVAKPTAVEPSLAAETASAPPATGLTLADIKGKVWRNFLARAGEENRNIKAWLSSAQPLAIEGGHTLIIGFDFPFLRDKLSAARNTAETALQGAVGQPLQIRCVLKAEYQASTTATSPPNQKKSFRDELEEFANDYGGVVSDSD